MESEWALKVSIVDAASRSCDLKVIGACCNNHQRARWWTHVMTQVMTQVAMEAVKLKKRPLGLDYLRRPLRQITGIG